MAATTEARREAFEALEKRIAAAKAQKASAEEMAETAKNLAETAKTMAVTAQQNKEAAAKELEEAEQSKKKLEERWEVIDVDDEDTPDKEKTPSSTEIVTTNHSEVIAVDEDVSHEEGSSGNTVMWIVGTVM